MIKDSGIRTKLLGIRMNSLANVHVSVCEALLETKLLQKTAMENVKALEDPVVASISYQGRLQSSRLSPEDHENRSIVAALM